MTLVNRIAPWSMILLAAGALGNGAAAAQTVRGDPYRVPTNHSFGGALPGTNPTIPAPSTFYPRLAAFGRCVVRREPSRSVTLRVAYSRRDKRAVSATLAALAPAVTACRRLTDAPREAGLRRFQLAAIGDALRERDPRAG